MGSDVMYIFLKELIDRIAAMLNFNLQQLCGPKCRNLKVRRKFLVTCVLYVSHVIIVIV